MIQRLTGILALGRYCVFAALIAATVVSVTCANGRAADESKSETVKHGKSAAEQKPAPPLERIGEDELSVIRELFEYDRTIPLEARVDNELQDFFACT